MGEERNVREEQAMRNVLLQKAGLAVALVAIAALGVGLLSSTPASADGSTIGITSEEIKLGHEGKVTLWGDNFGDPGLGAWTVDVYYNPEVVSIVECGAQNGGVCNPEYRDNAARITGSSAGGLSGEFQLGSLWFTCKQVGETGLELDIKILADSTLGEPQPVDAKVVHGWIDCFEEDHEKVPGDADCDGEATALDASLILQYSAEMIKELPCPDQADVNGDGHIDAIDATVVLQMVAGLLT
jgi:hypothetical protein